MESSCDKLKVGKRIEHCGNIGTIKYIGNIPGSKGEWLGIDWDDSSRGKHNGSHEGHQYFQARHEKSGSFIRNKKINAGKLFLDAVRDRYGLTNDGTGGIEEEEMFVTGSSHQKTAVEVVGAVKVNKQQSQLSRLDEIVLRDELVCGAEDRPAISQALPLVSKVDLTCSLLSTWCHLADIADQLPLLRNLNVSKNRFESHGDGAMNVSATFSKVKTLLFNYAELEWSDVAELERLFTELQELHCCFNNVSTICSRLNISTLKLLNLESNPIEKWSNVEMLDHLPSLETLILNNIGISSVFFPDCSMQEKTDKFRSLRSLSLNRNLLAERKILNELNKLRSLQQLQLKFNPLNAAVSAASFRGAVIASIERLSKFNNTEITPAERVSAEFDFLKELGGAWRKAGGHRDGERDRVSESFICEYPRFYNLMEAYGVPEDNELTKDHGKLKQKIFEVDIDAPGRDLPLLRQRILGSMTVQKLKALVARLYKINLSDVSSMLELSYTSPENKQEYLLDNDYREVEYYSLGKGDLLHAKW